MDLTASPQVKSPFAPTSYSSLVRSPPAAVARNVSRSVSTTALIGCKRSRSISFHEQHCALK